MLDMINILKGYRTIVYNVVVLLAGALGYGTLPAETLQEYTDVIIIVAGVVLAGGNILLRLITTTPPFTKPAVAAKAATKAKAKAKAKLIALPLLLLLSAGLAACATQVAKTPQQTAYGIERDFNVAQTLILQFFQTDYATPEVKVHVKKLESAAFDAVVAVQQASARGDNMAFAAALAVADDAIAEILSFLRKSGWLARAPPKTATIMLADHAAQPVRVPLTVLED